MRFLPTYLAFVVALAALAGCGDAADPAVDAASADTSDYADRMAAEHADDTTAASPMVQEPDVPVTTETVTYATLDGADVTGYYAEPVAADSIARARGLEASASLPGVIVIHEWWGLNDNIRAMTRRLAGQGYRALAVDLYGGQSADAPDQARQLMQQAMDQPEQNRDNLRAAYEMLAEGGQTPVGVIGWCFGGGMSLQAALAMPDQIDATVIYYGHVGDVEREALETLEMPILGLFGGQDQGIPVEGVRTFEQTLDELGKEAQIQIYDDAGHAFANPTGDNYVASAAQDAWQRTTAFLDAHLYPGASD